MQKFLFFLLAAVLTGMAACKKEAAETAPLPAVVGNWTVQPWLGAPVGGTVPYIFFPPFELELLPGETGWERTFIQDNALEWDLINGDQSIVLTSRNVFLPGDTLIRARVFDIIHQNEESGEWISPYAYFDTLTGITTSYPLQWFLQRSR